MKLFLKKLVIAVTSWPRPAVTQTCDLLVTSPTLLPQHHQYHWKFHRLTGRTTGQPGRWCVR